MDEEDGNSSRLIDLSNGGNCAIHGNVMHQGPNAENFNAIGIGLEGLTSGIEHKLNFSFNTITNERQASCLFLSIANGFSEINVNDNIFAGPCNLSDNITVNSNAPIGNIISNQISEMNFVKAGIYDYHLTENSPGINEASIPVALPDIFQPNFEYKYNAQKSIRNKIGIGFDIGAFEYNNINHNKELNHQLSIFPNPTSSLLNVVTTSDKEFIEYSIYTTIGTKVQEGKFYGQIDVSNLVTGLYYLVVDGEPQVKFVKE